MLKCQMKLKNSLIFVRSLPFCLSQQIQIRSRHNAQTNTNITFQSEVRMRRNQATNSVLFEAQGNNPMNELYAYCSKQGRVENMFRHYVDSKPYLLVEFAQSEVAAGLMQSAYHAGNHLVDYKIRAKSRFLTFTATEGPSVKNTQHVRRELNISDRETIFRVMRREHTIDGQIRKLYDSNKLSDFSSRLRFLTALQMEEAISGIFYDAKVLPFGSSVNGFGQMESDLDMILLSYGNRKSKGSLSCMPLGKPNDVPRNTLKNNLYVLQTIARHWMHGVVEVTPVLNARVPIIKYVQSLTQLDCDLSMGNISGFQMSEILYTFGEIDKRVRPFVFYIRAWAKEADILRTFPSQGLSNFMITSLAIFFLQQLPNPILPPADDFISLKDIAENIQQVTDISKLSFKTKNTSSLADLLLDFFNYYSSLNYSKDALSIASGSLKANKSGDSIHIYNLLDQGHNICRNVNDFERNQFIEKCRLSRDAITTSKADAVGLLEFNQNLSQGKMNLFVNNIMKAGQDKKPRTIYISKLMKSR